MRSLGNLLGNSHYAVWWNLTFNVRGLQRSVRIWKRNANVHYHQLRFYCDLIRWSCNHSAEIWDRHGQGNRGTAFICSRCRRLHYIWSQRAIRKETVAWWELLCQTPDPDSSPQRHDIIHLCCPLRLLSGTAIFSHRTDQEYFWTEENDQTPLDITKFILYKICVIVYQQNYINIWFIALYHNI